MDDRSNRIPTVYRDGYERARAESPGGAANYVTHTRIGDPAADAVVEALAPFDQMQVHRFIQACMERQEDVLREAPQILGDFFERISVPPPWFDPATLLPGMGPIIGIPTCSSPPTSPGCWSRGSRRPSASLFS